MINHLTASPKKLAVVVNVQKGHIDLLITSGADMDDWTYAKYNLKNSRQERARALIKRYGFPIDVKKLLPTDYYEYDALKGDIEAMQTEQGASMPAALNVLSQNEGQRKNLNNTLAKDEAKNQSQYGDATAKELDKYIKNYKLPKGKTRTGLLAPFYDFVRNFNDMEDLELETSDKFFHCKANYEAASRNYYGVLIASMMSVGREITDKLRKNDCWKDIWLDIKADERGITGAALKKTLKEACPTHYKKYK